MKLEANIAGVPVNITFDSLPEESKSFVIEYGLRQYVQDGAAVSKTFTSGETKGMVKTDEQIATEKREGVEERVANLLSGDFTRRGPSAARKTPEEIERESYIMAELKAAAKASNVKLPTKTGKDADPEKLAELVANYYAKFGEAVDKEVARRLKSVAKVPVNLSELGLA
jgi:hypothetical protein